MINVSETSPQKIPCGYSVWVNPLVIQPRDELQYYDCCLSWLELNADCTMKPRGIKAHFQTSRRSISLHCYFAIFVISWFYQNIYDLGGGHSLPMNPKSFSPACCYSTFCLTQSLWTLHIKEKSFFFGLTSKAAGHTWRKMSQLQLK